MKQALFAMLFLIGLYPAHAQILHQVPLQEETRETINHSPARMSATSVDTVRLRLPFFDDFSSIQVPMDSIKNISNDTVEVFTRGLHGITNNTNIIFYLTVNEELSSKAAIEKNPANPAKDSLISDINGPFNNKTWYVKVTGPFSFKLYYDAELKNVLIGNGKSFLISKYGGYWLHPGSSMGHDPDPLKWISGQGAYINNRFPINPPSIGVATFDGIKQNGSPYNPLSASKQGNCDTLTSRIIDLGKYSSKDSLILSFYWQGAGNGEAPSNISGDADSLWLELKNSAGKWNWAWGKKGIEGPFKYQAVQFSKFDSSFYHKNFQFRFRSFGSQAGMYDVWNIDYVYLNSKRNPLDSLLGDFAIAAPITPILQNYRAMPYNQFSVNRTSNVKTSFKIQVKNNKPGISQDQRVFSVYDNKSYETFYNALITTNPLPSMAYDTLNDMVTLDKLDDITGPTSITSKVFFPYSDSHIPGVDFGVNNFDSTTTDITDYFAYDDGSAESGIVLGGNGSRYSKMASKFALSQADNLQYIQIYFPQVTLSEANQSIFIQVIKKLNNFKEDDFYYTQPAKIVYTNSRDNFTTYTISPPIRIEAGDFYVGLEKITDIEADLTIGHDKNSVYNNTFYAKVGQQWSTISSFNEGSFMIRPLFGPSSLTAIQEANGNILSCDLFPNPSPGIVTVKGEVKKMKVYDLSGRLVVEENFDSETKSHEINLTQLSQGFYLVHLSNDNLSVVKKLLISK